MNKRDDLDTLYSIIKENYIKEQNNDFSKYFLDSYQAGDRTVYQKNISETKKFDVEWVTTIESYFPSIDKICKNPKSHLKYEDEIIDVERAKKTGARSIRHLASNTHLIRDIDEDLNVTPKKILVEYPEQDYWVYENRFIASLIKRLFLFVRNRYEVIKNNVESFQKDHLNAESEFNLNNTNVQMKIELVVKKDLDDHVINEHNHEVLKRVERLNLLITGIRNSEFMRLLKGAPDVHPPIMKTNTIAKNPDFRNAYNLWLFLDKYSILGYDVDVREKDLTFDDDFISELEQLFLVNYVTVLGNQKERHNLYDTIPLTETVKKKTKVVSTNPKDLVKNPDLIMMEDNTLNEYFLNRYKALFDKSINPDDIKYPLDETSDEEIKRALRQTIEICNGLYAAKFEINEEDDIFRRLVTEVNLEDDYKDALERLRYAHLIHDVKRVDYNNSLRLERRKISDLEKINKAIIKKRIEEKKYDRYDNALMSLDEKISSKKQEIEEKKVLLDELKDLSVLNKAEEEKLNRERASAINRVNEKIREHDLLMHDKFIKDRDKRLADLELEKSHYNDVMKEIAMANLERRKNLSEKIAKEREVIQKDLDAYKEERQLQYEKEMLEIEGLFDKYHEELEQERRKQEENEEQIEKEMWASMLVQNYEDYENDRLEAENLKKELALKRSSEEKRIKNVLAKEQKAYLKEKALLQKERENSRKNELEANKKAYQEKLDNEKLNIEAEDLSLRNAMNDSLKEELNKMNEELIKEKMNNK